MEAEKRIKEMGIELPALSAPKALYVPVVQTGNLCYVSGQIPMLDGKLLYAGKVGEERTLEDGEEAAKICAINILASLKAHLGDLDRIVRIVKLQAFVNSKTGFMQQHIVVNAASQLLYDALGEKGHHARTAVGTNQLPMDATVEIEAIVEVQ
ncbi:MAG: RidA family protein [Clostridia bacterium]|nr:RidA family protein [Clostridia bacterium]